SPRGDGIRPPPTHLPILCAGQAVCPELSSSEEDSCTISCVNDENCPQGTKCCARSPCSRSCVVPLIERNECSRDDQCMENQKCCFSSCARRCMVPTTGKHPGDPALKTPSRDTALGMVPEGSKTQERAGAQAAVTQGCNSCRPLQALDAVGLEWVSD
ncbi:hypothetical protein E2I00_017025, partial [Balaenoptera physalus]